MLGWSLVVVYESPTERLRAINLYDGLAPFRGSQVILNPDGFRVPNTNIDGRIAVFTLEGDPANSGAMNGISEALRYNGRLQEALDVLNKLSGAVEQTAEYLFQRAATISAMGGHPNEVVALLERAVAADGNHAGALFSLALENDRHGNDSYARDLYEKAASQFPTHVGTLLRPPRPLLSTPRGAVRLTMDDDLALTEDGAEVLAGRLDRVRTCGIDRWLGGVQLTGTGPVWRWDRERQQLRNL